jgi:hypothetical protein
MNEEKRKRILRWGCLILAGVFTLSLLGSVDAAGLTEEETTQ